MQSRFIKNILVVSLLGILYVGFSHVISAQTVTDLRDKISDTQAQIDALEKEIADYQNQLTSLGKEKDSLARSIKELDLNAKKLATDIKVTEKKIASTVLKKQQLASSISDTSDIIRDNEAAVSASLRDASDADNVSFIEQLLTSEKSIADVWREIDRTATIRTKITELTLKLKDQKTQLEVSKKAVEENERTLRTLTNDLKNQKKVIDANTRQKNALLKQTKNSEVAYAKLVKERQAQKDAFEADVRTYESQLKFILDPSSIPRSGSKVFNWPVDKVRITQSFGKTSASGRLYASGTHNGVDFGVPLGTPVRAVLSGTVLGSGNTDLTCPGASYGNWILIRHDNGLTSVFGHLSLVTAQTGSRVQTGEIVAYSGSTGYSTGPHLHISVFASTGVSIKTLASKSCSGRTYTMPIAAVSAYLDPMMFFPTI